jgi:threonine dehydrogenase-like Zn-dependent dehydrogenase
VKSVKTRPVRHRFVLRLGQHLPALPHGYQTSCQQKEPVVGAQAPLLRVPLADGTLVPVADVPSDDLIPSLLSLSDVMGTGWFAADAACVQTGSTVVVVGDGAVGLLGVLSAGRWAPSASSR